MSVEREVIQLKRDCLAHLIPFGSEVTLKKECEVVIEQCLGGNFTVNVKGSLLRIDGKDADALGKEPSSISAPSTASSTSTEVEARLVWEQLSTCYDPEIPVNIVDLGLIYDCQIIPLPTGGARVAIAMTLTAPGCGMGPILASEIERKVKTVPNASEVTVQLVFDPPWDQSRLSDVARIKLGLC